MTAEDFAHEAPVSQYGAQRRAAWLARLQGNHDMARRAALAAHGQTEDHRVVQAGQAGLFGHMTPEDMGATVAARAATVGGDWYARPLERNGGTFTHATEGPAPARVDLTQIHNPGLRQMPTLADYMRNREQ
jgi:hypothetical protein